MHGAKLILVEGLPGSGKSTLAQFLTWCLEATVADVRWWYEEELAHPVYVFHDRQSLQATVASLNAGDHAAVIAAALTRWRHFADLVSSAPGVVLIDSCLFGYLTWSLFPLDVPEQEITAYVSEVVRIISVANPGLIYLYQDDVAASLRRICDRRGPVTEQRLMEQSTQSRYGRRRHLRGFDGMVEYWSAYRRLTDSLYETIRFPRIALETTAGDWSSYEQRALDFLGIPRRDAPSPDRATLSTFIGDYEYLAGREPRTVSVVLSERGLILRGMPETWRDTPLRPRAVDRFAIESLPFELAFERAADGSVAEMRVSGPELLEGTMPRLLRRRPT